MNKVMRIGTLPTHGGGRVSVYIKAEITEVNNKLSISGVIGPSRGGNAYGGCGQIDMEFAHRNPEYNDKRYAESLTQPEEFNFAPNWNRKLWLDLLEVWHNWHLNDMQAGCEHQQAMNWGHKELTLTNGEHKTSGCVRPEEHPEGELTKPCPMCGYKYGTAWHHKELPQSVIDFIASLPETDKQPAWV